LASNWALQTLHLLILASAFAICHLCPFSDKTREFWLLEFHELDSSCSSSQDREAYSFGQAVF